jgi:hypothetical protein
LPLAKVLWKRRCSAMATSSARTPATRPTAPRSGAARGARPSGRPRSGAAPARPRARQRRDPLQPAGFRCVSLHSAALHCARCTID